MTGQVLTPFPRGMFFPNIDVMTQQERLVFMIEARMKMKEKYGVAYRNVIKAIEVVESDTEPAIAALNNEQSTELKHQLRIVRDSIAKGFTQTISRFENSANELASGTFHRDSGVFMDYEDDGNEDWLEEFLEWLSDLLHDLADVFDDIGMGFIGDVMREIADASDWLNAQRERARHQGEGSNTP